MLSLRKAQFGWVMYDFANTIFSMNIVTFFFAPWIVLTLGVEDIWFSLAYSASMILVAVTMPGLGRKADQTAQRLAGLKTFTYLCVVATVLLSLVALLNLSVLLTVALALLCFACANYFYEGSLTFYNSLLAQVSDQNNIGRISGLGVGVGYLGAIVGLLLVMPFTDGTLSPFLNGRQFAFLPTAMLFLIFALPTFFWVREKKAGVTLQKHEESFWQRTRVSLKETRDHPGLLRFLIGDYLVEDAVATTVLFMAVYAEAVIGFSDDDKIVLFITSTSSALVGALIFGWLADKLKAKRALLIAVSGWVVLLFLGAVISSKMSFYVLGGFVGVFLAAVWTTSRPLLNTLVPEEKLGQFYGLYTLSGRAAATIGPLLWGLIVYLGKEGMPLGEASLHLLTFLGVDTTEIASTIHYRLALISLLVSMLAGLIVLLKIPNRRAYETDHAKAPTV